MFEGGMTTVEDRAVYLCVTSAVGNNVMFAKSLGREFE
jgi:hypothetical protein